MGDIQAIRRLHHVQGWSERRISRELDLARNTVRAVLKGEHDGKYTLGKPRARPVIGPYLGGIQELLEKESNDGTWKKQRLTARRIYHLLQQDHGYVGSESTVRRAVRKIRLENGVPIAEAFVPLQYEPSVDGQVDFFEADVRLRGEEIRTSFLLVRACYSTRCFVHRVPAENQEALFEGLSAAFEHFGGVFHNLWFDNMSLAVDKILGSRSRKVHERFKDYRLHYSFKSAFCAPNKGSDKGLVENGVGYTRRNALSPVPEIDDWVELDAQLETWMAGEDERISVGRRKSVGELWLEERDLIPLPSFPFDGARAETRKVSAHSLVRYKTNLYSVPAVLVGAEVTVKIYAQRLEIHGPPGKVAEHPRLYGRHQTSFILDHYLELLHWKPRAFDRAAPVRAARGEWPPAYELLLRVLRSRLGDAEGTRSFIEVLWLHKYHGLERVRAAVRHALTHEQPSYAAVLAYLDVGLRADAPAEELSHEDLHRYPDAQVTDGHLEDYNELLGGAKS